MKVRNTLGILAVGSSLLAASMAVADVSDPYLRIEASSSLGTAVLDVASSEASYDPETHTWSWSDSGVQMWDGANLIASWDSITLNYQQDPVIFLNFVTMAGGAPTTVTITSGLLSFPALNNPDGVASAGFTLTDSDTSGSANLNGNTGTGADLAFLTHYNGFVPSGTTFAEAIDEIIVNQAGNSNSENFNTGFVPIAGPVSDMSMQISFALSANDSASGTSVFAIVPEPAGVLLLAFGAALIRRR